MTTVRSSSQSVHETIGSSLALSAAVLRGDDFDAAAGATRAGSARSVRRDDDGPEACAAAAPESAKVVRVEVQAGMPAALRELILDELNDVETQEVSALTDADVDESGRLLELGDLMALAGLDLPDLKDAPFQPLVPGALREIGRRPPPIAPGIAAGPPPIPSPSCPR